MTPDALTTVARADKSLSARPGMRVRVYAPALLPEVCKQYCKRPAAAGPGEMIDFSLKSCCRLASRWGLARTGSLARASAQFIPAEGGAECGARGRRAPRRDQAAAGLRANVDALAPTNGRRDTFAKLTNFLCLPAGGGGGLNSLARQHCNAAMLAPASPMRDAPRAAAWIGPDWAAHLWRRGGLLFEPISVHSRPAPGSLKTSACPSDGDTLSPLPPPPLPHAWPA